MEAFRTSVPEPVRFSTSGAIGSAAFWVLNEAVVAALPPGDASVTAAWFLSYILSIWLQHLLHSTLVYGWTGGYWTGLAATCKFLAVCALSVAGSCHLNHAPASCSSDAGYSGALVASVPINAGLVQVAGLSASNAWGGTLLITGVANYFLLSKLLGGRADGKAKQNVE